METVAEENPLRSATSRIVMLGEDARLRELSRRGFELEAAPLGGFESEEAMDSLNCRLLLADTTGR